MAVSFDLYDTLVTADRSAEPWRAVPVARVAGGVGLPDRQEADR